MSPAAATPPPSAPRRAACRCCARPSRNTCRPIPTGCRAPTRATARRSTAISATGSTGRWTPSPGATWRPASTISAVNHGWAPANRTISLLGSIYRRPCVDLDGLRNPVEQWRAAGGKLHAKKRRKISSPAEVLPRWRAGIDEVVAWPAARDAFWAGFLTGMRLNEVLALRWERVDRKALIFRVERTKSGVPLELPITRQLADVFSRRWKECGGRDGWVFPSPASGSGRIPDLSQYYKRIGAACGTRFWYHGLRNAFITVAERELMMPPSLTKRLLNHAPPRDITQSYAADWTIGQLREPAQRIADRIEALMMGEGETGAEAA